MKVPKHVKMRETLDVLEPGLERRLDLDDALGVVLRVGPLRDSPAAANGVRIAQIGIIVTSMPFLVYDRPKNSARTGARAFALTMCVCPSSV